ncbi:hypothetical protein CFI00_00405 [Nocardioides sp. S5]|uniref:hypothetical protein n=1 Tax=Nocardioides sp. S5 TaxID=2017486 RepID=UPI001A8E10FE|nr:hypothetical protein [Nocardioides sp. S5]QSR28988.1 hypothetical protein CFI00_00405 [Nocardioides sp. S5]
MIHHLATRSYDDVAHGDAPLFVLLRSTLGLPPDDPQWWACDPKRVEVDLVERTLAGLRAWEPDADLGRR